MGLGIETAARALDRIGKRIGIALAGAVREQLGASASRHRLALRDRRRAPPRTTASKAISGTSCRGSRISRMPLASVQALMRRKAIFDAAG